MIKNVVSAVCVTLALSHLACEEENKPAMDAAPAVSALKTAEPPPAASAAEPEAAEPPEPTRPEKVETELTSERRAKLEQAYSDAKGFIVAKDIEEQLKKNEAVKEEKNAIKAFDAKAKGKWVLFAGTMVNLTDSGFDMAIVYTPQLPNDPMGMSRQFFTVTFSNVDGYDSKLFKVGNTGVVLAKYDGEGKASPAHEVVAAGHWQ